MKIENAQGKIWYGLHFYPGVAEYKESEKEYYRVFLNEETLRQMDPTFAGRPVFVEHVIEVDPDINQVKNEADGWVIESFYNQADGKHWVKFITVSDAADRAIRNGYRLSNSYFPKSLRDGGVWNGVSYSKQIMDGEYDHLAIVNDPRYDESIILTPDQFKKYNEDKLSELKKLSNKQEERKMKFNFFKRTKVENSVDPDLCVILPKSQKEVTLAQIINAMDEKEADKNSGLADMSHKVKMHDGSYMNVGELLEKHKAMNAELEALKMKKDDEKEKELDLKVEPSDVKAEGDLHNKDMLEHPEKVVHDDSKMNEEDEEAKKKALQLAEHEEKEIESTKKKNEAVKKAEALKNAHQRAFQQDEVIHVNFSQDMVQRGKSRYGSN